jgi:hypothetical protein
MFQGRFFDRFLDRLEENRGSRSLRNPELFEFLSEQIDQGSIYPQVLLLKN